MLSENSNLIIRRGQPGTGVKVVLHSSVYTALMRVVRIEMPSEVLGVLLGVRERSAGGPEHQQVSSNEARRGGRWSNTPGAEHDWVIIKEAVPVALMAEASGLVLDKREWDDLQARLSSAEGKGLSIVGWFYADPAIELLRSRFDLRDVQQTLAPGAPLLLVVNPTENSGGFYRWQGGTLLPLTGFYEALPHKNAEPVIPWSSQVVGVANWAGIPLSPRAVDGLPEPEVPARAEDSGGPASPARTEAATRGTNREISAGSAGATGIAATMQANLRTQVLSSMTTANSSPPVASVAGYGELDGVGERVQRVAIAGSVVALILTVALFLFMIAPADRPSMGQAASPTQVTSLLPADSESGQAAVAIKPTGTPTIAATSTARATSTGTATITSTVTPTPTPPSSPTAPPPAPVVITTPVAPVVQPPAPTVTPSATAVATQRPARPATATPRRVPTRIPATRTPVRPTSTPISPVNQPTNTPLPATTTPVPTLTSTPIPPPATPVPPGSTNTPAPPVPTDTPVPLTPTYTLTPSPTNTIRPTRTSGPTDTPVPTDTVQPTDTPIPTNTRAPIDTPRPTNTVELPRR